MPTSTVERLEALDHEVEGLMDRFVVAISQLQKVTDADDTSLEDGWRSISRRLQQLRYALEPDDFDKEQLVAFAQALLDIRDLVDDRESFDSLDQLLVRFERLRHVVRDALDEHVNGVAGDSSVVLQEMFTRLPTASRDQIGELVGVNRRTLTRWLDEGRPPSWRLQVVARLVAILRHNWSSDGILAWFRRPRRDLGGKRPLDVLKHEPIDEDVLLSAARAGRSQYAS